MYYDTKVSHHHMFYGARVEVWFFFQVILVEFGSYAFSTTHLSLEQWMWCLLFGVGTLLWQQIVTTIPARKMPKFLRWGQEVPKDADIERALGDHSDDPSRRGTRHGQILWMRSLTRLQQQVRLVLCVRLVIVFRSSSIGDGGLPFLGIYISLTLSLIYPCFTMFSSHGPSVCGSFMYTVPSRSRP